MNEKNLHTWEFPLKDIRGNMKRKLLQKRSTGKTTECSKHSKNIFFTEKYSVSELNRCIFQISLKYIKLGIPKILFILVLCNFKDFSKIFNPPPPSWRRGGACHVISWKKYIGLVYSQFLKTMAYKSIVAFFATSEEDTNEKNRNN